MLFDIKEVNERFYQERMRDFLPDRIIDIHTHTYPTSDDSTLSPEQLIDEAKRIGLDGICITDHDGFWDPEDVERLSKAHDFPVLPGCEVTTEEGHLLVYGLRQYIFGMHRARFVKQLVDTASGAIVVAHPYRRTYREQAEDDPLAYQDMLERAASNTVFTMVDAIEVQNGRGSVRENGFSGELAALFRNPGTGASDAHRLEDLGTFATEFFRRVDTVDDLIHELKAGRFRPVALNARTATRIDTQGPKEVTHRKASGARGAAQD